MKDPALFPKKNKDHPDAMSLKQEKKQYKSKKRKKKKEKRKKKKEKQAYSDQVSW
jgi:hypothetical protein